MARVLAIGKVAVRVMPDTSNFRTATVVGLKKETKGLEVRVPIDPQTQHLRKKLKATVDMLNRQTSTQKSLWIQLHAEFERVGIKARLKGLISELSAQAAADPVKLHAVFDSRSVSPADMVRLFEFAGSQQRRTRRSLEDAISRIVNGLPAQAVKLKVDFDKSGLGAKMRSLASELRKDFSHGLTGDIANWAKIRAQMAKASISDDLSKVNQRIQNSRGLSTASQVVQWVAPKVSKAHLVTAKALLKASFTTMRVMVKPEVDSGVMGQFGAWFQRLSGARVGKDMFDSIVGPFKDLDRQVPTVMALVPAITAATAAVGLFSFNLLALGRSIASILPGIVALPTVFAGAATSLGVLAVAMKDFGARLPEVGSRFKQLAQSVRAEYWVRATGAIRSAFNSLFPVLERGVAAIASGLGRNTEVWARAFETRLPRAIGVFLPSVVAMNDALAAAAEPVAGIAATFLRMGERILPEFGRGLADVAAAFSDWISGAEQSGRVYDWIDKAVVSARALWGVAVELTGVFAGLTRPLEELGMMDLESLKNRLVEIKDAINSTGGQETISSLATTFRQSIDAFVGQAREGFGSLFQSLPGFLSEVLPTLSGAAGDLAGALAGGLSDAMPGLASFATQLSAAVSSLAPAIRPFVAELGNASGVLGQMAVSFQPIMSQLLGMFTQTISQLQPTIASLSAGLSSVLSQAMPGIQQIVNAVSSALPSIGESLGRAMAALAPVIGVVASEIGRLAEKWLPRLTPLLSQVADMFVMLSPVLVDIAGVLGTVADVALAVLVPALSAVISNIRSWVELFTGLYNSIKTAFDLIAQGDWTGAMNAVHDGFMNAFDQFIADAIENAKKLATDLIDNVKELLGIHSPSTVFYDIGYDVTAGLFNGLKDGSAEVLRQIDEMSGGMLTKARNTVTDFVNEMGGLPSKAATAVQDLKAKLEEKARTALDAMVTRVREGIDRAVDWCRGIGGRVETAIGDLSGTLRSAGASALDGFKRGLEDAWGRVKTFLRDITRQIPTLKGPAGKDAVLLVPAGQLIMQGLLEGLMGGESAIVSYLAGLKARIAAAVFVPPTVAAPETGSQVASGNAVAVTRGLTAGSPGAMRAESLSAGSVHVTNYYPQAEPASRTVNRALELQALLAR